MQHVSQGQLRVLIDHRRQAQLSEVMAALFVVAALRQLRLWLRRWHYVKLYFCSLAGKLGNLTFLTKSRAYLRIASGVHAYLRMPRFPDWEARIRQQLEERDANWLALVRGAVFDRPGNPYHEMFRLAGCEYGDLRAAVERDGLEGTLSDLMRQGVYLTHDEFKGTEPIVRSGRCIPSGEASFVNPFVRGTFEDKSSGSRSAGTRTRTSTAYKDYTDGYWALHNREFDLTGRALIQVRPILPSLAGIGAVLALSRLGHPMERWFAHGGTLHDSAHYRALTRYFLALARFYGSKVPSPSWLPPNDFSPVARWIAEEKRRGRLSAVYGFVSPAVRVAAAALGGKWDISGTWFFCGGEEVTNAKRKVIESAGARVFPRYWISEVGPIGFGCRNAAGDNCVHIVRDSVAVVTSQKDSSVARLPTGALFFSTLLPETPNVVINAEMGDSGVVERARCDCAYTEMGFTERLRDISSFSKLTGQGMTLAGTDVVRLLEEVLPAKFGGVAGDYQLIEREDGQTALELRVDPRVGPVAEEAVKRFFMDALRQYYGGALASRVWEHSSALRVVCAPPIAASGKILPLQLLGPSREPRRAS